MKKEESLDNQILRNEITIKKLQLSAVLVCMLMPSLIRGEVAFNEEIYCLLR